MGWKRWNFIVILKFRPRPPFYETLLVVHSGFPSDSSGRTGVSVTRLDLSLPFLSKTDKRKLPVKRVSGSSHNERLDSDYETYLTGMTPTVIQPVSRVGSHEKPTLWWQFQDDPAETVHPTRKPLGGWKVFIVSTPVLFGPGVPDVDGNYKSFTECRMSQLLFNETVVSPSVGLFHEDSLSTCKCR